MGMTDDINQGGTAGFLKKSRPGSKDSGRFFISGTAGNSDMEVNKWK